MPERGSFPMWKQFHCNCIAKSLQTAYNRLKALENSFDQDDNVDVIRRSGDHYEIKTLLMPGSQRLAPVGKSAFTGDKAPEVLSLLREHFWLKWPEALMGWPTRSVSLWQTLYAGKGRLRAGRAWGMIQLRVECDPAGSMAWNRNWVIERICLPPHRAAKKVLTPDFHRIVKLSGGYGEQLLLIYANNRAACRKRTAGLRTWRISNGKSS